MFKKPLRLLTSAAAALVLVACGNAGGGNTSGSSTASSSAATPTTEVPTFETKVENEGTPITGGTLRHALVSDSPFKGTLSQIHYSDTTDANILVYLDDSILGYDENLNYDDSGMATIELNRETKVVTIKLKRNDYKWSDGQPFTIDDYIYAIEVISHPDYDGIRFDDSLAAIEGMEAYHTGQADTISGIKKVDDQTVEITFTEISPSILRAGGMWVNAAPKHILKDIPVADQVSSDAVRKNPVGLGPFKVQSIVDGESVTMVANEHYWQGKPKLDGVVVEVVSTATIADEMRAGNYDIASMPNSAYEQFKELSNVSLIGDWANVYTYVSFKLGKWDPVQNKNVPDPNAKMADKALRQAMGYALDNNLVGQRFYKGLRKQANSIIVPFFGELHDETQAGYTYDPEKAKKLLDDAGYKDVDGDGIREDKNGQKLTINFASMSGDQVAEPLATFYMQQWKEIGLDVQLKDGRLIEFKAFYEEIEKDDTGIDVFQGAWQTGYDPVPQAWSEASTSNYSRYASPELTAAYNKLVSEEAFDAEKSKQFYKEWQNLANEEAFAIPTLYRISLTAVNKRVKFYDVTTGSDFGVHQIELTSETGATE